MEEPNQILQDRLDSIYREFIHNLGHRTGELRSTWETVKSGNTSTDDLIRLRDLAHELQTCSAPFNLFLIADRASKLEKFLTFICEAECPLSEIYTRQAELLIKNLEAVAQDINGSAGQLRSRRWEPPLIMPEIDRNLRLVYMLETDPGWAGQLSVRLQLNYQVQVFSDFDSLTRTITRKPPRLIITDTCLSAAETGEDCRPDSFSGNGIEQLPVIFIGCSNDMETRLTAVRSGATWFCNWPADAGKVLNKIREITVGVPKDPFRVMVISHRIPMAKFYAMVLNQEGMDVSVVDNPLQALKKIENNRPEVILMNMSLPELNALELTEVIRQEENFAGIAIVFLSEDINDAKQLTAMNSGADDLISLPIEPEYLVAKISARVSRARTLNTMNRNLFTALRELENQQFALDQHAIVSVSNLNGSIIYVNDKLCDISGYKRSELIGKDHRILNSGLHPREYFEKMWSTICDGRVWQGEICNRKQNGDLYWVNTTIVPFIDKQSRPYQFVSISSDITSKKFTEQDLLEARDIAVNASQAKSDFLSKMSHELRTPLNAVLGFSQLLKTGREQVLSETQLQYINEIHNAGDHLLSLINEVLDLSRIEADQLFAENVTIPLTAFLDECVALIQPLARQKQIDIFTAYRESDELFAFADPLRLKQVMVNLLSNAVKYNSTPGLIKIEISRKLGNIVIEVTDTGEGIEPAQVDNLFQPFVRLPQHKKIEGVGIGLALSKRLTELMGGKIGVRSMPGKQTTFWVEIQNADQDKIKDKYPSPVAACPETTASGITAPLTLLYVEDNEANLLLVREFVTARVKDAEILHAYTVQSGIELALQKRPNVILMDLELPDMNGFEGFNLLKQEQLLKSIPVIAISAYADAENIQLALKLGFEEYITKPIDINDLLATIEKYHN